MDVNIKSGVAKIIDEKSDIPDFYPDETKQRRTGQDDEKIKELALKLYDSGFNVTLGKDKKPYAPTRDSPFTWTRDEPLTEDEIKKSIEILYKDGKDFYVGFFPGEIKRGKHKGKYTWGVDFDDKNLVDDLKITLQQCKKRGVWIEPSHSKGHHMYGITNTISHDEKLHDLKIELFGTQKTFLIVYDNFVHDLYDLSPVNIEKSWSEMQGYVKKIRDVSKTKKKKIVDLKKGVSSGERNISAFKLACKYQQSELTKAETTHLLFKWNKKNKPSLPDSEIIQVIHSAYRYEKKVEGKKALLKKHNVLTWGKVKDKDTKEERWVVTGANNIRLGNAIMDMGYHFKRVYDSATGQDDIYYYKNGYYRPGGDEIIRGEVGNLLGDITTDFRRTEALKHIRYDLDNRIERQELEPDVKYINCNNGIYNIETDELIPHDPDFYFINKLPVDFDPKAKCPNIEIFFNSTLYPDSIPLIKEIGGDILYREKIQHVVFVFLGGGRNGKGIMVSLYSKMLGVNNYSTRNLHEFISDRFAKGDLYGKMANFGSEVSSKYIEDSADLKSITGGEPVTGERKFKGAFPFNPYATLVFNANQLPTHKDKSFAFYQRWIVIPFPYTFARGDEKTNPNLLKELTTPEELSGLLNLWIEGLKRTRKNNDFSYVDNEEIPKYEQFAYPEYNYMEIYLENVDGISLTTDEVYNSYSTWGKENKFQIQTKTSFTRKLKTKFRNPPVTTGVKKVKGKSKRCYNNINWKLTEKESILEDYDSDNQKCNLSVTGEKQ